MRAMRAVRALFRVGDAIKISLQKWSSDSAVFHAEQVISNYVSKAMLRKRMATSVITLCWTMVKVSSMDNNVRKWRYIFKPSKSFGMHDKQDLGDETMPDCQSGELSLLMVSKKLRNCPSL